MYNSVWCFKSNTSVGLPAYLLQSSESLVAEYCRDLGLYHTHSARVFLQDIQKCVSWAFIDMLRRCSTTFSETMSYTYMRLVSQERLLELCIPKHTRDKEGSTKLLCEPFLVVKGLCTEVGILLLPEWGVHSFAEGCNFIPLCRSKIVLEPWRICVVI